MLRWAHRSLCGAAWHPCLLLQVPDIVLILKGWQLHQYGNEDQRTVLQLLCWQPDTVAASQQCGLQEGQAEHLGDFWHKHCCAIFSQVHVPCAIVVPLFTQIEAIPSS